MSPWIVLEGKPKRKPTSSIPNLEKKTHACLQSLLMFLLLLVFFLMFLSPNYILLLRFVSGSRLRRRRSGCGSPPPSPGSCGARPRRAPGRCWRCSDAGSWGTSSTTTRPLTPAAARHPCCFFLFSFIASRIPCNSNHHQSNGGSCDYNVFFCFSARWSNLLGLFKPSKQWG